MPLRFVHTADIHLDSPLKSLSLRDQDLSDLISNATRRVFLDIVDLCIEKEVDALLIAGDLYDGNQTSMKTAMFLGQQLRRLESAAIRVFIIRGNHDAISKITRELTLPDNVHVFPGQGGHELLQSRDGKLNAAIHGVSFDQPHAPQSLLPLYSAPLASTINIGMMHTSLDGSADHDPYAPCKLVELQAHGFDYWALGHVHKRNVIQTDACAVVMPGIPQGRDIGESGQKSVSLVTIDDDLKVEVWEHPTSLARFEAVTVKLDGIDDWESLIGEICQQVETIREHNQAEHLVARINLLGSSHLVWRARRDIDLLQSEVKSRLENGKVWIDKLIVSSSSLPAGEAEQRTGTTATINAESQNPVDELQAVLMDEVLQSDEFELQAHALAEEFQRFLPPASRETVFGHDSESFSEKVSEMAREGTLDVLARLHPSGVGNDVDAEQETG